MSSELKTIEKKLQQLKANKAKEEKRLKDNVEKLTTKYNEDQKKLKDAFDVKIAEEKKESASRIAVLTPEIAFYEKQQREISKLEEQMEMLRKGLNDRLNAGKPGASTVTEEKTEEAAMEENAEPAEAPSEQYNETGENQEDWQEYNQYNQY